MSYRYILSITYTEMDQLNTCNSIYCYDNERTSSMLDTPPPDKLYKHLHVFNACEQSRIVMIMGGSKMSKTEYDLKTIMYPAYETPHKLGNIRGVEISGNPDCHPMIQTGPRISSHASSLGSSGEPGQIPCSIWFSCEWGSQREGHRFSPCANKMGKHAYQARFDGNM